MTKRVRLTNGLVLRHDHNGKGKGWLPLQDVARIRWACEICPVRKYCGDNNEFDCQVYAMFCGFYSDSEELSAPWAIDEALERVGAIEGA